MNARMSPVEALISKLPQTISANNASFLASWDLRLQSFLEQFPHKQYFFGDDDQTSDLVVQPLNPTALPHILTDDTDYHNLETPRHARRDHYNGGGFTPHPQWQQRLDFLRFNEGDDSLAWIYKAKQYFSYYSSLEH